MRCWASFLLGDSIIMLKPFVCDTGSSPGVHTSLSILQPLLKVNLVTTTCLILLLVRKSLVRISVPLLSSLSLEFAQVIQILCVMPRARHTTWSVVHDETLSCIFRSFTFQGSHRTAEPSLAVAEPHGLPFSST